MATPSYRLLVIDDSKRDTLLLERILQQANDVNFTITHSDSARAGLEELASQTYDLVLLDYYLPDMDGLAFLAEKQQRGMATPIIMLTAFGEERLPVAAMQAGALDYFRKDQVNSALLGKAIQQAIEKARLQTSAAADAARLREMEETVARLQAQVQASPLKRRLERMTLLNALLVLVLMLAVFPEQSTAGEESVQYYLDLHSRKVECPPCDPKRPDLNCCKDNTYSFVQPDLSLPGNGLCGPTAVSNVVVNICGIDDADPGDFAGYLNMDFNAGTTSSDLLGLLNGQANRYRCLGFKLGLRPFEQASGWVGRNCLEDARVVRATTTQCTTTTQHPVFPVSPGCSGTYDR